MIKLYRLTEELREYWETWQHDDGSQIVHWGELGTKGMTRFVKDSFFSKAEKKVKKEIESLQRQGFRELEPEWLVMIEYGLNGLDGEKALEKRYLIQDRMNQVLGWTALGHCDGGSIDTNSIEITNLVIDAELAKTVIAAELADTDFKDYLKIYHTKTG
ncbi:hypothetical protein [Desulfosediminicola sp.]|uniref:hypothetical protein n=1 Tax=Desulfosediminicola sp. TaxID=2886825 RepID=UPI003AF23A36